MNMRAMAESVWQPGSLSLDRAIRYFDSGGKGWSLRLLHKARPPPTFRSQPDTRIIPHLAAMMLSILLTHALEEAGNLWIRQPAAGTVALPKVRVRFYGMVAGLCPGRV
ncbi:hypothetical protein EJ03DRAFT_137858 [Teratosphaeria nubilosa]|uniref:Uncharacterized protein n=1 Tax=Teratosphaeria nubilosa TaxID=161662 RepID=A0A6G1L4Y0_9PEZI|nr:hypothetical protein EJ03DRAFT_137858 [Teratosphaeria nubilosa]